MPSFVQFPHPGQEHRPQPPAGGTVMPWNTSDHRRKFLRAHGRYLLDGQEVAGAFAFWGEWEPQSRVVDMWPTDGDKPRFLHEPLYETPPANVEHQNTDPLVFGDRFLYTNCKQLRIRALRQLDPGSLILFGTGRGEGFILDTVFVVGDASADYTFGELGVADHPLTDDVIFRPLASLTRYRGRRCRAYRGASWTAPHRGLFSFVPCRPADGDVRFARPLLEPVGPLADLVHPKLRMGARVLDVSEAQIVDAWAHVRELVEEGGLALGVHAAPPATAAAGVPTDPSGAHGC